GHGKLSRLRRQVGDGDVEARFSQPFRESPADAPAGAGDESRLALGFRKNGHAACTFDVLTGSEFIAETVSSNETSLPSEPRPMATLAATAVAKRADCLRSQPLMMPTMIPAVKESPQPVVSKTSTS